MTRRLTRRSFLLTAAAAGLAACVDPGLDRSVDLNSTGRLRVLSWPDYIDADDAGDVLYPAGTLDRLTAETGISTTWDTDYSDNVAGFELVRSRAIGTDDPAWDIVIPTNWRAAEMIAEGAAEQIPIEIVPNHVNIDPVFLTNTWDRGCRYQMPWQAGITGIAYDPELTGGPVTSVEQLFSRDLAGRVGFIGEMREAVGLVMLANGDDPSRPTEETARAALNRIIAADGAGQIGAFTYEDFADRLESGELAAAMAWSGDAALLRSRRPDIEFVVPEEGAIQWFDTMVIPTGAANLRSAGTFMNFVYDPENAASITEWVGYMSPVMGVQEVLRSRGGAAADLAADPVLFPDAATRSRLYTWGGIGTIADATLDDEYAALVAGG